MDSYDIVIIGSGPAGMGAAFEIAQKRKNLSILMIDKEPFSTGGMRNDCKMNFTYPIGFPEEYWSEEVSNEYLELVTQFLAPSMMAKSNIEIYKKRASRLGCSLVEIMQSHLGTDGGLLLIKKLLSELHALNVTLALSETMVGVDDEKQIISTDKRDISYKKLLIAPGRKGFHFLQMMLQSLSVPFVDNIVDIGVRVETRIEHYPIVRDYYDPKFYFDEKVRTFCTNSGDAHVVKEKYTTSRGDVWYSVNGHAYSAERNKANGLVNFAILKTVKLTEPLASGQMYAENLGLQAALLGGG
ncbi:MAG: FAD-binding protein, partial [Spirochaetia bacterium]|nr:FAD-binding protein [Spirochaetia bacterium]